jgi:hypothetical protein
MAVKFQARKTNTRKVFFVSLPFLHPLLPLWPSIISLVTRNLFRFSRCKKDDDDLKGFTWMVNGFTFNFEGFTHPLEKSQFFCVLYFKPNRRVSLVENATFYYFNNHLRHQKNVLTEALLESISVQTNGAIKRMMQLLLLSFLLYSLLEMRDEKKLFYEMLLDQYRATF